MRSPVVPNEESTDRDSSTVTVQSSETLSPLERVGKAYVTNAFCWTEIGSGGILEHRSTESADMRSSEISCSYSKKVVVSTVGS